MICWHTQPGPDTWRSAHPDSPPGLPESLVQVIFAQAVAAVAAIHAAGAAHRDIKPDNLLIDKDGRVRLIDLGLAAQAEPGGASPSIPLALSSSSPSSGRHLVGHGFHASPPSAALQRSSTTGPIGFSTPSFGFGSSPPPYSGSFLSYPTLSSSPVSFSALSADFDDLRCSAVGSPLYRAPETFAEGARRAAYSARKADLWSLGVLLHELLTGSYCLAPDPDDLPALRSHLRDYASGRSPLYWPAECVTSPMAQDLVAQLLNPRPALRPSLASIQAHPFLASIDVNSPLPWLPPPPPSPEAGRPPIERVIASRLWVGREAGFAYGPPVTLVRT